MDQRSEKELLDVHPDLVKVIRGTSQILPFIVIQGLRTVAQEQQALDTNHSTTMHSRHLPNKQGFACAVDIAPLIDGQVSFADGKEQEVYNPIINNIKATAKDLNVPMTFGIDWTSFKDFGHVELSWGIYP